MMTMTTKMNGDDNDYNNQSKNNSFCTAPFAELQSSPDPLLVEEKK